MKPDAEYFRKKCNAIKLDADIKLADAGKIVQQQVLTLMQLHKEVVSLRMLLGHALLDRPGHRIDLKIEDINARKGSLRVSVFASKEEGTVSAVLSIKVKGESNATRETPLPAGSEDVSGNAVSEVPVSNPVSPADGGDHQAQEGGVPGVQ